MQTHLSPEEKKLIGYKAESSLDENYAGHSYVKEILLTLFSNKGACIGLVCILIIVGFAIFAPMVSPYTYKEVHSETTNLPCAFPDWKSWASSTAPARAWTFTPARA